MMVRLSCTATLSPAKRTWVPPALIPIAVEDSLPASGVPDGVENSPPRSCVTCALAKQMKIEKLSGMKVDDSNTLLEITGVSLGFGPVSAQGIMELWHFCSKKIHL